MLKAVFSSVVSLHNLQPALPSYVRGVTFKISYSDIVENWPLSFKVDIFSPSTKTRLWKPVVKFS